MKISAKKEEKEFNPQFLTKTIKKKIEPNF